ncbi:MAG: MFS transporter, partial [Pseudomonadota bacterium]
MTEKVSENYKWVILGVVTLGQTSICFGGLSIPPLGSFLSEAFALSKSEFGAIMSTLFLGAAIASFPSGRLADRLGVRKFLSFSMIFMGLLVILLFWTKSYLFLIVTGFLLGLGYGTTSPATNKAVAEWFRRINRGTAMSIKQTSIPLGSLLAALFFPQAALLFGWRKAFLVGGVIMVLSAVIPLVLYRETSTAQGPIRNSTGFQRDPLFNKDLLMNKDLLLLSLIATLFAMVQLSVMTYLILYLEEVAFFSVGLAGIYLGLASGSGLVGRICWGIISDRIFGSRRKIVLQIIASISGVSAILLSLYSSKMGVLLLLIVVLL